MRWVRLSNSGQFDFAKAVSLLGASVKESDTPIGMFGSGIKYAMAQALRQKIPIKIQSGGVVWTMVAKQEEFRGKVFDVVSFRSDSGKVVKTPITSEFGKEDWANDWFIFREFYSNMLDEDGVMNVVDGVVITSGVDIFLPYNEFSYIVDNINDYFRKDKDFLEVGTGRVYKKGVYVGTLDGIDLNMGTDVRITESRTMDEYDAGEKLGYKIASSGSVECWEAFFKSKKSSNICVYPYSGVANAIKNALTNIYGKFAICPNLPSIVKDCALEGYTPVTIPDNWSFAHLDLPNYLTMNHAVGCRELNSTEKALLERAIGKIKYILGDIEPRFFILETELSRQGDADYKNNVIRLKDSLFKNENKLIHTLIHEIGHLHTKAGDYDRKFTDFFVEKLTELCK